MIIIEEEHLPYGYGNGQQPSWCTMTLRDVEKNMIELTIRDTTYMYASAYFDVDKLIDALNQMKREKHDTK